MRGKLDLTTFGIAINPNFAQICSTVSEVKRTEQWTVRDNFSISVNIMQFMKIMFCESEFCISNLQSSINWLRVRLLMKIYGNQ
jgi:hypothetical protein